MGWLRNRRRRQEAERMADERMRQAGGDVDKAMESSQDLIGQYAADQPPDGLDDPVARSFGPGPWNWRAR